MIIKIEISKILDKKLDLDKAVDITFMTCVHAWHHFQQIMSQKKSLFMSLDHPRDVFVHSFINKLQSIEDGKLIIDTTCKEEHIYLHIMKKVAIKFFNCMGKNFTAERKGKKRNKEKNSKTAIFIVKPDLIFLLLLSCV